MALDLCVRGGRAVLLEGVSETDIGIAGGKIVLLGQADLFPEADRTINAHGKVILPGGIDTHSHLEVSFQGAQAGDDFYSGTVAAAFGGTTTIIDFAKCMKGQSAVSTLEKRISMAEAKSVIDYAFHVTLTEATPGVLSEMKRVVETGCPSFKMFTIYRKEGQMMEDGGLLAVFRRAAELGAVCHVHAENAAVVEYNTERARTEGRLAWIEHARTKPNIVETEAVQRTMFLSMQAGNALSIAHLSTAEGVDLILKAQKEGYPVYAETVAHYLTLTDSVYEREDGLYFICSPPLRKEKDVDRLWEGIKRGCPTFTGSDHASWSRQGREQFLEKRDGRLVPDFTKVPNGLPGNETRLPLLLKGVREGKIGWVDLVRVFSTNAARIFGLYPKKGVIAAGSDADLVLVDPEEEAILSTKTLHMQCDVCPYEGMRVKGVPVLTILRGKVVVDGHQFTGSRGAGEFVRRSIDPAVLKSPDWF